MLILILFLTLIFSFLIFFKNLDYRLNIDERFGFQSVSVQVMVNFSKVGVYMIA